MNIEHFDLIIIGSGPVALSALLHALDQSMKVALIGQIPPPPPTTPILTSRSVLLNQTSRQLLHDIAAWPKEHVAPCDTMHLYGGANTTGGHLHAHDAAADQLGDVVSLPQIIAALYSRCLQRMADWTHYNISPHQLDQEQQRITLQTGQCLQAQHIWGCDGRDSWLRQQLEIRTKRASYEDTAYNAIVSHQNHHNHSAWQRFFNSGTLALLPSIHPFRSIAIWTTFVPVTDSLAQLRYQLQHSHHPYGIISDISDLQTLSVRPFIAQQLHRQNMAILGDAAVHLHPMAGQGLNLGLYGLAQLTRELSCHKVPNYSRWAKQVSCRQNMLYHSLQTIRYHGLNGPLASIWQASLPSLSLLPPLRHALIHVASSAQNGLV